MSTLDASQRLSDGPFHRLADDVLRRLEPRYRFLRTHGLNERGESIKGQPDSYVGNTCDSCSIAFCYTVQRSRWGKKIIEDIDAARATSRSVSEIVVAIPHDVDRDMSGNSNWRSEAEAASGQARLRIIDGRDIARLLDQEHQDLRYQHLNVPYSRLSATSIATSARQATDQVLQALRASGRYDPQRYVSRSADRNLYQLWQQRLTDGKSPGDTRLESKLIPLVNDSGVGKTSLVCAFAQSLGSVLPVVLLQARDLAFVQEDSLVARVIQTLQGVLEPALQIKEEAAIISHLPAQSPLTVIVDGLDETHAPEAVRRAITFWLASLVGQKSILIVTSRREFWQMCFDQGLQRWIHPSVIAKPQQGDLKQSEPSIGIPLPDRFTEEELEAAWIRAGRYRPDLYAINHETRRELVHPFTLRVYLDLWTQESVPPAFLSRVDLMERWLNRRLDAESSGSQRIARDLLHGALVMIASKIASSNRCAISVDDLHDLPRFDRIKPPGPVVQALVDADILESIPTRQDLIRFKTESIQDFFAAEADVDAIIRDSSAMAEFFLQKRFSDVYTRLTRLGKLPRTHNIRHAFVEQLALSNPAMAASVMKGSLSEYSPALRRKVAELLGKLIKSRYRACAAFAISLLGELNCSESEDVLICHLFHPAEPHEYLKAIGATAFTNLECARAAEFIFRWQRFGVFQENDTYYFTEEVARLRRAKQPFRNALANVALRYLRSPSGEPMHARAIYVLASLGDERLVEHLEQRFKDNGSLQNYENHSLIIIGSNPAASLFAKSFVAIGELLAAIPNDAANNNKRYDESYPIRFYKGDVRDFLSPAFEAQLAELVRNSNPDISWHAADMIRRSRTSTLFYEMALVSSRENWMEFPHFGECESVSPELWLNWWQKSTDAALRHRLLQLAPRCPNIEVEQKLLECLDVSEFRGRAARLLGEYGSVRALPQLRQIITEDLNNSSRSALRDKTEVASALGDLRDSASVPQLAAIAKTHPESDAAAFAIDNLGAIGDAAAEAALGDLLHEGVCTDQIASALFACGTIAAVKIVIEQAKAKADGILWLNDRIRHLTWTKGWQRGKYHTHIESAELIDYVNANFQSYSSKALWDLIHALRRIDSPDIRRALRKWANLRDTPEDPVARKDDNLRLSHLCMYELMERGDGSAISFALDDRITEKDDSLYVQLAADRLTRFDPQLVAAELKRRLAEAIKTVDIFRLLALIGRFGIESDGEFVRPFLNHQDELVANVAFESLLRLTDPLLIPPHWREL